MEENFWQERWALNEIGFHQKDINEALQTFWPRLAVAKGATVFVPLCGKSRDMVWLRDQGHRVIGVELSALAVEAFFSENGWSPEVRREDPFTVYAAEGIQIYCGNFFALSASLLQEVTAVFDRASLIALPPAMRRDYAAHLVNILPAGCDMLLVTLAYPPEQKEGPPFSVDALEVTALFGGGYQVQHLRDQDILAREPRFRDAGMTRLEEQVFRLRRRG